MGLLNRFHALRSSGSGRLRRPSKQTKIKLVLGLVGGVLLVGGGYLWLRTSSLVAVERVEVSGLAGVSGAQGIRAALEGAAFDMTTLDVDRERLLDAVSPYPSVARIEVQRDIPHRLKIHVVPRHALAVVVYGGRKVAVAQDGTVLRGQLPSGRLPTISAATVPVGGRVTDKRVLLRLRVVAAAPKPLQRRIRAVGRGQRGLTASLRSGPKIYFGNGKRLRLKWKAVVRVLADPQAKGAAYIDVQVPGRPAVGGSECSDTAGCAANPENSQIPQA